MDSVVHTENLKHRGWTVLDYYRTMSCQNITVQNTEPKFFF